MADKSKGKQKTVVEEIIVIGGIVTAGLALQLTLGDFNKEFLAFPVNLVLLPVLAILFPGRSRYVKRVASGSLSVILLCSVTISALYMGLIPNNSVKISWPFVLLYLLVIINLAAVISVRAARFKIKDIPFYLNHLGLLILLYAAGPGSADKSRYFMRVFEDQVEWRAELSSGRAGGGLTELPVAIHLNDFEMDEYPTKLAVIEMDSGNPIPQKRPVYLEVVPGTEGDICRWNIHVDSVIHKDGLAPAAYVRVFENTGQTNMQGWVSCGNYFQTIKTLSLSENHSLVMTIPQPKEFRSHIEVYTKNGNIKNGVVKVNQPMTVGSWKIYQHSYDNLRGRDSVWSLFELVFDPWIIPAYIGIIMMIFGAIALFWKGGSR